MADGKIECKWTKKEFVEEIDWKEAKTLCRFALVKFGDAQTWRKGDRTAQEADGKNEM